MKRRTRRRKKHVYINFLPFFFLPFFPLPLLSLPLFSHFFPFSRPFLFPSSLLPSFYISCFPSFSPSFLSTLPSFFSPIPSFLPFIHPSSFLSNFPSFLLSLSLPSSLPPISPALPLSPLGSVLDPVMVKVI